MFSNISAIATLLIRLSDILGKAYQWYREHKLEERYEQIREDPAHEFAEYFGSELRKTETNTGTSS